MSRSENVQVLSVPLDKVFYTKIRVAAALENVSISCFIRGKLFDVMSKTNDAKGENSNENQRENS